MYFIFNNKRNRKYISITFLITVKIFFNINENILNQMPYITKFRREKNSNYLSFL